MRTVNIIIADENTAASRRKKENIGCKLSQCCTWQII